MCQRVTHLKHSLVSREIIHGTAFRCFEFLIPRNVCNLACVSARRVRDYSTLLQRSRDSGRPGKNNNLCLSRSTPKPLAFATLNIQFGG